MNPNAPSGGDVGLSQGDVGLAIGGSLLGALGGFYDTYQSNKTARENTDKTIAANSAEAQKAYERDVAFWNMQNAYNSPAAQMARYQAAGLNPHMVGQSGTGSGNASQMVKYNPPNMQYAYQPARYGSAIQQILPMVMQVGEWMQSMKMSEETIKGQQLKNLFTATQDEKQRQAIQYLTSANPKLLSKLEKELGIMGTRQYGMASDNARKDLIAQQAYLKLREEYGDEATERSTAKIGGLAAERLMQAKSKTSSMQSKSAIDKAQASYADYSITNPQSLINLVVGSVLSMASGATVKMATPKRTRTTTKVGSRGKYGYTETTMTRE